MWHNKLHLFQFCFQYLKFYRSFVFYWNTIDFLRNEAYRYIKLLPSISNIGVSSWKTSSIKDILADQIVPILAIDEKILLKKRRSKKSKMPQLQARNKISSHKVFEKHTVQYKSARDELKEFRFQTCQISWRRKIMDLNFY